MELRTIYFPLLRQATKKVEIFDSALEAYSEEMLKVMKSHHGLGLAANQVGLDKRLIVLGYEPNGAKDETPQIPFLKLCNPEVVKTSKEKDTQLEGCLSLPGLELPVTRSLGVTVTAQDLRGKRVTIKAKGLFARVLQHEIDHLNGILFTDRADNYQNINDYKFANIVFFGSDDFSLPVLRHLHDSGLNVIAVVTETDKPAGRGQALVPTAVKVEAEMQGIAVFQPTDKEEIVLVLEGLKPDLVVLASYGKILPSAALEVPTYGALNVHPSLLPMYRGSTPIQTAIINGDKETGVTIMQMVSAVDAGGVLAALSEDIGSTDTSESLRHRLAELGARLLVEQLPIFLSGQAKIKPQNEEHLSTTAKLTKEMGQIDWANSLQAIDRQIRAFQPWPGAFTYLSGKRLKFLSSELVDGKLVIGEVQLEGKGPAKWKDFERGYAEPLKNEPWYGKIT